MAKRNQPAEQREITVERNGRTYRAQYRVTSDTVTVEAMSATSDQRITTRAGRLAPHHLARGLLIILIEAGLV